MLGFGKPKIVDEYEADGPIDDLYHEIRQSLRASGINLIFRVWAGYDNALPAIWDAVRPFVETRAFEAASDDLRSAAVRAADPLGKLEVRPAVRLGKSQTYQIEQALKLYHYINPKLLLLVATVNVALSKNNTEESPTQAPPSLELIERGEPGRMYAMEMVAEEPDDHQLQELFDDIKQTLSLASINSDYRTLALWPNYLTTAWARLKTKVGGDEYQRAAAQLQDKARRLAAALPYSIPLSKEKFATLVKSAGEVAQKTERFEQILPPLILNIALLGLDWQSPDRLAASPFPAAAR
ncbi:MAG: hypothetical protein H0X01_04925 [Nitrospira sp.]|nr:hypothetical protein [Nitrospira sp.]